MVLYTIGNNYKDGNLLSLIRFLSLLNWFPWNFFTGDKVRVNNFFVDLVIMKIAVEVICSQISLILSCRQTLLN